MKARIDFSDIKKPDKKIHTKLEPIRTPRSPLSVIDSRLIVLNAFCKDFFSNKNVLDVGGGSGKISYQLAKLYPGISVTSIDSNFQSVTLALKILKDEEIREKISKIEGVDLMEIGNKQVQK
jgi:tRNA G46 methylase TrmB